MGLFLLFIVVPAAELALLVEVGRRIGTLNTLALIVLTGILGASLARYQGLRVLRQVQADLNEGRMPGGALVDGVIILIAGALLVTPGILTDVLGFLCLVPLFRGLVKRELRRRFERAVEARRVHVVVGDPRAGSRRSGRPGPDEETLEPPYRVIRD